MEITKKDLVYISMFMIIFYLLLGRKEHFTNPGFDSEGNLKVPGKLEVDGFTLFKSKVYVGESDNVTLKSNGEIHGRDIHSSASINLKGNPLKTTLNSDAAAIRNLSQLANDLTKNGKLVVPGGLEVRGNLKIGSYVLIKPNGEMHGTDIHAKSSVNAKYITGSNTVKSNGEIHGKDIHAVSSVNAKYVTGSIIVKSNGSMSCGNLTASNIKLGGNVEIKSNGEIHGRDIHAKSSVNYKGQPVLKNGDEVFSQGKNLAGLWVDQKKIRLVKA